MNKKTLVAASFALVLATVFFASQEDPVKALMRAKSGYAHALLDAVVKGELAEARAQAFRLKAVAETGDWNVLGTEEYVRESESFLRATERLIEATKETNDDAVALAYMDVTLTCVHCHRYIRAHAEKLN